MKIYLTKDIEKVGLAGEIVKVSDGFGSNFIIARVLALKSMTKMSSFIKTKHEQ